MKTAVLKEIVVADSTTQLIESTRRPIKWAGKKAQRGRFEKDSGNSRKKRCLLFSGKIIPKITQIVNKAAYVTNICNKIKSKQWIWFSSNDLRWRQAMMMIMMMQRRQASKQTSKPTKHGPLPNQIGQFDSFGCSRRPFNQETSGDSQSERIAVWGSSSSSLANNCHHLSRPQKWGHDITEKNNLLTARTPSTGAKQRAIDLRAQVDRKVVPFSSKAGPMSDTNGTPHTHCRHWTKRNKIDWRNLRLLQLGIKDADTNHHHHQFWNSNSRNSVGKC